MGVEAMIRIWTLTLLRGVEPPEQALLSELAATFLVELSIVPRVQRDHIHILLCSSTGLRWTMLTIGARSADADPPLLGDGRRKHVHLCQQLKMSAFSDAGKVKGMKQMHGI